MPRTELTAQKIRLFRLYKHHLNARRKKNDISDIVGACGMQNTPPGAWETALFNRVSDCSASEMNAFLYAEKSLLQAWSFRGAPFIFPVTQSSVFLSALIPQNGEEWIYTKGISEALKVLPMPFDDLLDSLKKVLPGMDHTVIRGKPELDQTLADWMLPLLPAGKASLWNSPSPYGRPNNQTVGGAVVSFLLRPCSFMGLVVFGKRRGISPSFTSYKGWLGYSLERDVDASKNLVRKYLHCYGPSTPEAFRSWLACSGKQARRLWTSIADEITPLFREGKKTFILSKDEDLLDAPPIPQRKLLLLGGHDPYLDQRDRHILLNEKKLHQEVWRTVSNPGVILLCGKIIGIWTSKKKSKGVSFKMTLWNNIPQAQQKLYTLAEEHAAFRKLKLLGVEF